MFPAFVALNHTQLTVSSEWLIAAAFLCYDVRARRLKIRKLEGVGNVTLVESFGWAFSPL